MNMICALVFLMACVGIMAIPITTTGCGTGGTSVTSEQKTQITAHLNSFRYFSKNIKWDENLASLAQTRAATCPDEKQSEILDCAGAEVDEIVQFMPQSHESGFDVRTFTQYMYKSAEYSHFPESYIRWYTCNPNLILYMDFATKVGCGYSTCDYGNTNGTTFVCYFSPKGPGYCSL